MDSVINSQKRVEYSASELKCRLFLSLWATLKSRMEKILEAAGLMSLIYRKQFEGLLNFYIM